MGYDSFATILLPDTFLYNPENRLFPVIRTEENSAFLPPRANSDTLLNWLDQEGGRVDTFTGFKNPVPVKSCFGGLAIYRGSKFFEKECTYLVRNEATLKYANKFQERACEHVTFHSCLQ